MLLLAWKSRFRFRLTQSQDQSKRLPRETPRTQLPVDFPLPTDATRAPHEVQVSFETPIKWSKRAFFRATKRHVGGIVFAFAPTYFAIGAELITGDTRGFALILGPFWLGFAVSAFEQEA